MQLIRMDIPLWDVQYLLFCFLTSKHGHLFIFCFVLRVNFYKICTFRKFTAQGYTESTLLYFTNSPSMVTLS